MAASITAEQYAKQQSISIGAARYRLNKMVEAGTAESWIEIENSQYNVGASGLPYKVKRYEIKEGE